ncbi:MAG TPA: hypothetical protein EYQ24_11250 [Bacteroidetes bacterium]|nr:hypothetical protein [Bacteroidota bacterium]HIL58606.1 hypothetical protein [Rhodothermales bacterium]
MTPDFITHHLDEPRQLEARFREDPAAFAQAFSIAHDERPADRVLAVWHARLDAEGLLGAEPTRPEPTTGWRWAEVLSADRARQLLGWTVALVMLGGLWSKLPEILGMEYPADSAFYARYTPLFVLLPLLGVLAFRYRARRTALLGVGAAALVLLAVQAFRTIDGDGTTEAVAWLGVIHLPGLLLALGAGLALGPRWRDTEARMGYLQLIAETLALAALFLIGGVVLTILTFALFEAIGVNIEPVFEWVVPFGAIGVLPVGALMASQRPGGARVAPLVARVFGPLALAVLALYLPTLLVSGALDDRDTLLSLNIALIAVLAIVLLVEAERPDVPRHWTDGVAFALAALALAADVTAFAFVAGRLAEGGLTPNRLAVVGFNALAAVHLGGLAVALGRRVLAGGPRPDDAWTARFLSVYTLWGAVVVLLFPLFF